MSETMAELVKAFPPQPLQLTTFTSYSGWESYIENKAFEASIQGRPWDTLGSEFAQFHLFALGHMGPDAFVAIIPAYLAALLRGDTENQLPALVFAQLIRKETFDARVARLTEQQRAVIVRVLKTLVNGDRYSHYKAEISAALNRWQNVHGAAT